VSLYLEVASISPILKKVTGNGGKIVQDKRKLPDGMGYVGEFADPIGIVWGLHSRK
jgi:predicted enzyme related to lactoylglutathione lyase